MYVGALTLDVLLGDVRSLKQKRSVVRPLIAEVHRRFPGVAVGETGHLDLHRRAEIGIAVVSSTAANAMRCWTHASGSSRRGPRSSCWPRGSGWSPRRGSDGMTMPREPGQGAQARRPDRRRSWPRCWSDGSRTRGSVSSR